jgi:hypothetical protein
LGIPTRALGVVGCRRARSWPDDDPDQRVHGRTADCGLIVLCRRLPSCRCVRGATEILGTNQASPTRIGLLRSETESPNAGVFEKHVQQHWKQFEQFSEENVDPNTIVILADDMVWKTSGQCVDEVSEKYIHVHCADCDVKTASSRGHAVDPMLKLYLGIPLILVENRDVPAGYANGSRVTLSKVVLKPGMATHVIYVDGFPTQAVKASCVHAIICVEEDDVAKGAVKREFVLSPSTLNCIAKVPYPEHIEVNDTVNLKVKMVQFAVLINNATTGHKLQGSSKDNLVVSMWSYKKNWPYVILSRVRTLAGLFLRKPLNPAMDYSPDPRLMAMLLFLQEQQPQPYEWNDNDERSRISNMRQHFNRN